MISINEQIREDRGLRATFFSVEELIKIDADKVNVKGWNPAACTDQSKCESRALCAFIYLDAAIELYSQLRVKENANGI